MAERTFSALVPPICFCCGVPATTRWSRDGVPDCWTCADCWPVPVRPCMNCYRKAQVAMQQLECGIRGSAGGDTA